MGSSPWKEFVAGNKDLETALARARLAVFDEGRYFWDEKTSPRSLAHLDQLVAKAGKRRVIECGAVLDVRGLGDRPGCGVAGPFPTPVLVETLGTAKPSRKLLTEKQVELFLRLERGECAWVQLYAKGKPSEVCFLGMTLDSLSYEVANEEY